MTVKLLWSTPVYQIDLGYSKQENSELFSILSDSKYSLPAINNRVGKFPHQSQDSLVVDLYKKINFHISEYAKQNYPLNYKARVAMSWVYNQKPGEYMNLHSHNKSVFVAVYYVRVPQNSGNLILLDPRGGVNWINKSENSELPKIYEEIEPLEGSLVIFPGYILHEVRRNESPFNRMCIAHNIDCDV